MLPPLTRCSGEDIQRAPMCALISRAMAAKDCIALAAAGALSGRGQLRQALALAAQVGSEAEPVVELGERGQVRRAAPERRGGDAEAQVAGDARQLPSEEHRLAILA